MFWPPSGSPWLPRRGVVARRVGAPAVAALLMQPALCPRHPTNPAQALAAPTAGLALLPASYALHELSHCVLVRLWPAYRATYVRWREPLVLALVLHNTAVLILLSEWCARGAVRAWRHGRHGEARPHWQPACQCVSIPEGRHARLPTAGPPSQIACIAVMCWVIGATRVTICNAFAVARCQHPPPHLPHPTPHCP